MGIAGISPEIDWCYHEDLQGTILATSGAPDGFYNANFHTDSWGNLLTGWAANNPYLYLGGLGGSRSSRSGSLRSAACV